FATLGASDALLPLLRAARAEGHLCVATLEAGGHASEVARLTPGAVRDPAWELLLAPQRLLPHVDSERGAIEAAIDAVVVALDPLEAQTVGSDSLSLRQRREDQLRKLALAGVPLVLLVPCCEGIVGYELDMIRRDTNVLLFPYSSLLFHAGTRRAQALLAEAEAGEGEIGEVRQIVVERHSNARTDEERLAELAGDVHLLDHWLGGLEQITASSSRVGTLEDLAVHVQGRRHVARWSWHPAPTRFAKLSLLGSKSRVDWTVDDDPLSEQFGAGSWKSVEAEQPLSDDNAVAAWRCFAQRLATTGETAAEQPAPSESHWPEWEPACRAAEVADHAPRSVRRSRAVQMQQQTPTEEDTFKGMMAAGSCALLLLTLGVFIVFGLIESVRFPAERNKYIQQRDEQPSADAVDAVDAVLSAEQRPLWQRIWPVYPLLGFLALQLLRLVFPQPPPAAGKKKAGDASS
ncbi:MAG: hypothetical protein KDB14_22250, partial [Planctomycetales bacterium]|nr:hypothetical protein [Planctomycetales bacterium]